MHKQRSLEREAILYERGRRCVGRDRFQGEERVVLRLCSRHDLKSRFELFVMKCTTEKDRKSKHGKLLLAER